MLEDTRKGGKEFEKKVSEEFCNFFSQANFPGEKLPGRLPDDNKGNVISIRSFPPPSAGTRRKRVVDELEELCKFSSQ